MRILREMPGFEMKSIIAGVSCSQPRCSRRCLVLGTGADAGGASSAIIQALRRGAGDSLNQTGQQIVRRNLNVQPTLTIWPGFPVRVIVNRDLMLEPYGG